MFTEQGEKKTMCMLKNHISPLGGLAGKSTHMLGHLYQDPARIPCHRSTPIGDVWGKRWAGDNSFILSYSKAILSLSRCNLFIMLTCLLGHIHTSVGKESRSPIQQTIDTSLSFQKHSCASCFSWHYPFLSSHAGKPGQLWSECISSENVSRPTLNANVLNPFPSGLSCPGEHLVTRYQIRYQY